jgi:tRNA dimethylallyltransferase
MNNHKVFVISGPTASGKTSVALRLARENNGELINADSRQIYKYLDIGTDKRIKTLSSKFEFRDDEELRPDMMFGYLKSEEPYLIDGIPMHLISFVNPDERFDVHTYQKLAYLFIDDVLSRGKTPVLVGGTGLYVNAVTKGYLFTENETSNEMQREELEDLSVEELIMKVDREVYESMNESDQKNPRRLIRAIERGETSKQTGNSLIEKYDFELIFPEYNWDDLKQKIRTRVIEMVEDGIVEEVEKVLEMGYPRNSVALQGIGYREVLEFLDGEISKDVMIERIQTTHIQYARRQKTWFKNQ